MLMTLKELSQILSMNAATLRVYLGNYRFSKYVSFNEINVCAGFIKELKVYMQLKYDVSLPAKKIIKTGKLDILTKLAKE